MAGAMRTSTSPRPHGQKRKLPGVAVMLAGVVALSLIATGCGGSSGSPSSSSTSQQSQSDQAPPSSTSASHTQNQSQTSSTPAATLSLDLTIPVLLKYPLLGIPARYTCDGANTSLPLRWGHIPHGTAELALFILSSKASTGEMSFAWAVTGLKPTSRGLAAGKLPPGAVVGRNSSGTVGYSICPPVGRREAYYAKLFALGHPLNAQPGVDASTLYARAEADSENVGLAAAAYQRR
jgi:phosphatidylethanolamine-binding protein (PEBP) family uncharacterized protein